MMGYLGGYGFGYPVTYSMIFGGIEALTPGEETSSGNILSDSPWGITVPPGYDLFVAAVDINRFMGAPTAGYISVSVQNWDTEEYFRNLPLVRLTSDGGAYSFASVSPGSCKIPSGTSIVSLLSVSGDITHNWTNAKVRMTIYGYLREASTE
jgi:hypothetical protein